MRDYIIINGVNSLSIKGLAITKLPSIYKPIMRTEIEEIDGRNGDIITELGYGAYNKELTIGLFGDYDIDEIIAFFNQKGTIIFSNENDKVYNFDIVDQIEFEKLIKFRSATINIHCQPFKYPLSETPIEVEYEYVTGEGENITLDDTDISALELDLKGNTSQTGTPTPSSPIPVNVVSGDNEVQVCGKNIINTLYQHNAGDVVTSNGITFTFNQDGSIKLSGTATSNAYVMLYGELSQFSTTLFKLPNTFKASGGITYPISILGRTTGSGTYQELRTATGETEYGCVFLQVVGGQSVNTTIYPQIEKGNEITSYEPYIGNTYNIDLPVENLFDTSLLPMTKNGVTISKDDEGNVVLNGTPTITSGYIGFDFTLSSTYLKAGTYTSSIKNKIGGIGITINQTTPGGILNLTMSDTVNSKTGTLTADLINGTIGVNVRYDVGTLTNFILNPQLEIGSKAHKYTPYGTTPIELCKIGNYQDYFYKDSDKWYLHKEIGKVVIDGTNTNLSAWSTSTQTNTLSFRLTSVEGIINNTTALTSIQMLSNRYLYGIASNQGHLYSHDEEGFATYSSNLYFRILKTTASTFEALKTWLSSNNLEVWYPLATPTNTEITYQPLIEQLNAIELAQSKENQTNISQVNNDLPFVISASALKKGSDIASIVNDGNIYSKPLIDIEGTGLVTIYLDNTQMFQVDLSELNNITIDTELLEAYSDTQLANRKVVGDYSKFKLQVGTNQLNFGGALTKATITRYKRWL